MKAQTEARLQHPSIDMDAFATSMASYDLWPQVINKS